MVSPLMSIVPRMLCFDHYQRRSFLDNEGVALDGNLRFDSHKSGDEEEKKAVER